MKKWFLLLFLITAALPEVMAQGGRGFWHQEWEVQKNGDSIALVHILPGYGFSRPVDLRRYRRLVDAVRKVYPIAKIARAKMAEMEDEHCRLPTTKAQKA